MTLVESVPCCVPSPIATDATNATASRTSPETLPSLLATHASLFCTASRNERFDRSAERCRIVTMAPCWLGVRPYFHLHVFFRKGFWTHYRNPRNWIGKGNGYAPGRIQVTPRASGSANAGYWM